MKRIQDFTRMHRNPRIQNYRIQELRNIHEKDTRLPGRSGIPGYKNTGYRNLRYTRRIQDCKYTHDLQDTKIQDTGT